MKKKIMWFPSYKIIVKQMQFYYQDVFQDISNLTSSCCHSVLQRELYIRSLLKLTQKLTLELYQRVLSTVCGGSIYHT